MDLGVSYVAAHLPDHIRTDMRHLKEIGCTEVLFALQENHIFHLTGALRHGARIAKENGLRPYVVVWGYANTFGGGQMSILMLQDTEMWRVGPNGRLFAKACLNNPKVVSHFKEFTEKCREHGYEGMFVDEPTPQACFCRHCRTLFEEQFGKRLKESVGTPEYRAFQVETVMRYTRSISQAVKGVDEQLKTMVCIMPHDEECFEAVSSIPELDVFATDPYWLLAEQPDIEWARKSAQLVKDMCDRKGKSSQVWLNGWAIREGLEEQIYSGGEVLASVGCDSMYTWSFRGALGTSEEAARPEVTWENVCRLYRELSGA